MGNLKTNSDVSFMRGYQLGLAHAAEVADRVLKENDK